MDLKKLIFLYFLFLRFILTSQTHFLIIFLLLELVSLEFQNQLRKRQMVMKLNINMGRFFFLEFNTNI